MLSEASSDNTFDKFRQVRQVRDGSANFYFILYIVYFYTFLVTTWQTTADVAFSKAGPHAWNLLSENWRKSTSRPSSSALWRHFYSNRLHIQRVRDDFRLMGYTSVFLNSNSNSVQQHLDPKMAFWTEAVHELALVVREKRRISWINCRDDLRLVRCIAPTAWAAR